MLRGTFLGAACAASLCCGLSVVHAQEYARIISFGDSLSDAGNAFVLSDETFPQSPPYFAGRFSNGPVWVERLGGEMHNLYGPDPLPSDGNISAAVGLARSISTPLSFHPDIGDIPDVPDQLDEFEDRGGKIGANDLVTLWAGANDLLAQEEPDIAALAQIANLNRLVGTEFEAKTILIVNLPPIPGISITGNPSLAFNQVLDAGTRATAAANPDVNIVQMDVFTAFIVMASNPAAFGITDPTPCVNRIAATVCANPNQHLFWDDVHPTAAGHEALALFASLLLTTGENALAVAPLAESALYSRLDASSAAFDRTIDAIAFPDHWRGGFYAEVVGSRLDQDDHGAVPAYSHDLAGLRIGGAGHVGPGIAGVSLAYLQGDHEQAGLTADVSTVQGDVYGVVQMQSFFINAQSGFSYTSFDDIDRFTNFPTVFAESDTEGWSFSGAIGAGLTVDLGRIRLIPNGRVGYVSAETNPFSESAPILALSYGEREISSGYWSAGLRAVTEFGRGRRVQAYAELGYESLFATETDDITARLVNNTAVPVTQGVGDPASRGFYIKVGAGGNIDDATTLSLDYGLALQDGDGESHTGKIQLKVVLGGDQRLE